MQRLMKHVLILSLCFVGWRIDAFSQVGSLAPRPFSISSRFTASNLSSNTIPQYSSKLYAQKSSQLDFEDTNDASTDVFNILNAAFLVAGTTIGGGFLALPTVVAPSGFYPSAATLFGVWAYFLAQSFVLVECITTARKNTGTRDDSLGVAATAKSIFGKKGEATIGLLLIVLIQATLVSQISRAGMMFPDYRSGCLISALSIAAIVFGPRSGIVFASKANAALTSLFLLSAMGVFGCGIQIADFSRLAISNNWSSVPSAIPTFLQLLVYGEIVPSICQILNYNTRQIHSAILLGSFMTLSLQIGWSGLGLSLVSSTVTDPVNVLLASSGPVQAPLFCLAFTAILTTILGSYLALLTTVNDFLSRGRSEKNPKSYSNSILQRVKVASIITIPASLIACTSPSIFLQAIDFAGSYPVLILWGVIPPVIALKQRYRELKGSRINGAKRSHRKSAGPSIWIAVLGFISFAMIGANTVEDVTSILKTL